LGEKLPHVVGVTAEGGPEGQSPYGNLRSKFGFKAAGWNPSCSGWLLANRTVEQVNPQGPEKSQILSSKAID
jgi:hypothetical protein